MPTRRQIPIKRTVRVSRRVFNSLSTRGKELKRESRAEFPLAPFGPIASLCSERNAVSKSSALTMNRLPSRAHPHKREIRAWSNARRCRKTTPLRVTDPAMISQYFMESLPFSSPDEFPTPRNLSACFSGLNDRQAHGQYHKTLCPSP